MLTVNQLNQDGSLLSVKGINKFVTAPRGLCLWRPGEYKQTLTDVGFSLFEGERVGLVGVSGAGKTTLLNLLLALDHADDGTIYCQGRQIRPASVRSLRWYRRTVQYIPQDPASSLDPGMTVRELVKEPLLRLDVDCNAEERIRESLDSVGLDEQFLGRRPAQLSGGQAQRVAIARAIATRPRLILADEPLSGLDLPVQARVIDIFKKLNGDAGTALLIVSHDLGVVARFCQRTIVLDQGAVIEDRATQALFQSPVHHRSAALIRAAMGSVRFAPRETQ